MVNSISQRLGNAAKAAGLVAILAGTSGCVAPGQRSGTNAPNMPYIVQPGFSQWNLGVGFLNLSNSAGAMNNTSSYQADEPREKYVPGKYAQRETSKLVTRKYLAGEKSIEDYENYKAKLKSEHPDWYAEFTEKGYILGK